MPGLDAVSRRSAGSRATRPLAHQPAIVLVTRSEPRSRESRAAPSRRLLVKPVTKSMIVDTLVNSSVIPDSRGAAASCARERAGGRLRRARILPSRTTDQPADRGRAARRRRATVRVAGNGREGCRFSRTARSRPRSIIVLMDLQSPRWRLPGHRPPQGRPPLRELADLAMTAHARSRAGNGVWLRHERYVPSDRSRRACSTRLTITTARPSSPTRVASRPSEARAGLRARRRRESAVDRRLDTRIGLMRVAGNRRLYLKLLRQFVEQQGPGAARIGEVADRGRHPVASGWLTRSGVAGNLGRRPVQAAAAALRARDRGPWRCRSDRGLRRRLDDELNALVGQLRPALGENPALAGPPAPAPSPASPPDPQALKALIAQMRQQLGELDPAAADVLDGHREAFRFLLRDDDFAEFEQYVHGYAFAEATGVARARGDRPRPLTSAPMNNASWSWRRHAGQYPDRRGHPEGQGV